MNSSDFKKQLLTALGKIEGNGSFVSSGAMPFIFSGMEIEGISEIGFPVNYSEINEIIKVAQKAPFGKGSKTLLDTTIRSAWEIDAYKISFNNKDWSNFIESIIRHIKPQLAFKNIK